MAHKQDCIDSLIDVGISYDDAVTLRRISTTLHRWHELECGDGNNYGSWSIERDEDHSYVCTQCGHKHYGDFIDNCPCEACGDIAPLRHKGDGLPYFVHHHYLHGRGKDYVSRTKIADREKGALRRLATIMARYPELDSYVQTDPRGCALYILRPGDIPNGQTPDCCYSRGLAVYK